MRKRIFKAVAALAAFSLAAYLAPKKDKKQGASPVPLGESISYLPEQGGVCRDPVRLFYYRPAQWNESRPVFIAFHGFGRKADRFCRALHSLADEKNVLIVCPEFSEKKYPGSCWYQEANMTDKDDVSSHVRPREMWTFPVVEKIVEEVKSRVQTTGKMILFGHSAGGQFLHRYSLFGGNEGADVLAVANSGWFTMPDKEVLYPYGIQDVDISDEELARAFARPVILFMGGADVKRDKPFRDTPEADAQGLNRQERNIRYFNECKKKAEMLQVPFRWKLETVDGVGHEGVGMAKGALTFILGE